MAFYSTGGTSFPDFGLFLFVVVCGLVSVVLNPPVLYRHLGAPFTVHRVTSFLIPLLNLISSILQIYASFAFILPTCDEYSQTSDSGNRTEQITSHLCGIIEVPVTTGVFVYSVTLTTTIMIPNLLTTTMLIARYFQLKFPLRTPRKRLYLAIAGVVSVLLTITTAGKSVLNKRFMVWLPPVLIAANLNPFNLKTANTLQQLFSLHITLLLPFVFQVVGVVFVWLTIAHLRNTRGIAASQSGRDPNKITLRILLLNAGSIVHTVLLVLYIGTSMRTAVKVSRGIPPSYTYKISSTTFFVILPILLSALNPTIYFCTSGPAVRKNNPRTGLLDNGIPLLVEKVRTVVGVVFVVLTIAHLRNTRGIAASQSGRDPNKITLRILLLNAGSIFHTVLLVLYIGTSMRTAVKVSRGIPPSYTYKISSTTFWVILPILLSALNPYIYYCTSGPAVRKNNTITVQLRGLARRIQVEQLRN
eukprot:sb/3479456/